MAGFLHGRRILLGVTGSIAAYKAAELLRLFDSLGAHVRVAMTEAACRFVGPVTFEALSGQGVALDLFQPDVPGEIAHIALATRSDLIVVAPTSANFLAKAAHGFADDLLSATVMARECPLVLAPAMNQRMWTNQATQGNVKTLLSQEGVHVVVPGVGHLACVEMGEGRLADLDRILYACRWALAGQELQGATVLVSAGPTREPIDPIRFISNRSSGKMGLALAVVAKDMGARVILVAGPTSCALPPLDEVVKVETAAEMEAQILGRLASTDLLLMAAAVADYRPANRSTGKIKKGEGGMSLPLERTTDILVAASSQARRPVTVGFAAETGDPGAEAARKMTAKGLDLVVGNDVREEASGFGREAITVCLIDGQGRQDLPSLPKEEAARIILERVAPLVRARRERAGAPA